MWDEVLNLTEINQLTCDSEGDMISYSNFTVEEDSTSSDVTCVCDTFDNTPSDCHGDM